MQRTYTIGVITRDLGDAYAAMIISGIERYLRQHSFFFLTVAHHNDKKLLDSYSHILLQRGVEGLISVDTLLGESMSLPTIAIAGHRPVDGVTNILLDHRRAALLALQHLCELGHREIAFMKGPQYSSDSTDRWQAIVRSRARSRHRGAAGAHDSSGRRLVHAGSGLSCDQGVPVQPENALYGAFCFQRQFRVGRYQRLPGSRDARPERYFGRGFDDIKMAPYSNPPLTTVRQPLLKMGEIAARSVLNQIKNSEEFVAEILIEPEFVVRKSTGKASLQLCAVQRRIAERRASECNRSKSE